MQLAISPARHSDARVIASISNECSAHLTAQLGVGPWSGAITQGRALAIIRNRMVSLASDEFGTVVGYFGISDRMAPFWPPTYWSDPRSPALGLYGICVRPSLQGHGIGRWMMAEAEKFTRQLSRQYLRLDAYALNPNSVNFYRRLGYDERGMVEVGSTQLICFEKRIEAIHPQ